MCEGFDTMIILMLNNFRNYKPSKYFLQNLGKKFVDIDTIEINRLVISCHLIYFSQYMLCNPNFSASGKYGNYLLLNFGKSGRLNTNVLSFIKNAESNGIIPIYIHCICIVPEVQKRNFSFQYLNHS
jgi:hypothetical protein